MNLKLGFGFERFEAEIINFERIREILTCALKAHVKSTNISILSCKLCIVLFKH
jgi:hypothetical protein